MKVSARGALLGVTMTQTNRPPLAQALKDHREATGISQAKLASLAEISVGHIGLIESGDRSPSPEKLESIVAVLGISDADHQALKRMLPGRNISVSERLARLEEAFAELVARLDDE